MSSRPDPLDLRQLGRFLDDDADFDMVSAQPSSSRPSSARTAHTTMVPRPSSRLSLGSRPPRGGGEFFSAAAAASSAVPRSVGGGSGVFSDPGLESPRGSESPMPVIFISEQTVASTCRGMYTATSRFCIKRILPGQHHCGTPSHKNKKYKVKGDTYWAPGGFVRGELVALCGECVERGAVPDSMREAFSADKRMSTAEWRNLIIDAAMPTPSLHSVNSAVFSEDGNRMDEKRREPGSNDDDVSEEEEPEVISLMGAMEGFEYDFTFDPWEEVTEEYEDAEWSKHILQHQGVMDGWIAKMNGVRALLFKAVGKIDGEVIPTVNLMVRKWAVLSQTQATMQEALDHATALTNALEARVRTTEDTQGEVEDCVAGITEVRVSVTSLRERVDDQELAAKETEGLVASLIQKVSQTATARTASVAKRVSALETKSGWVQVGDRTGDDLQSVMSVDSRSRDGSLSDKMEKDAMVRLKTLEAKVEIQLERAKSQGVIFHKVAFSSELEFMQWYLKENTSGKGLAAFVDLVSVWSFASLTNETASEWLQSLSRQRTVGLDNKVEVEYSHSMSTRYPAAFVGKAELITSTQTFKIFEKLVLWRGGGVGDGIKERLLDSLRMAVERQRVYCEDMLPTGVVRDHAIRSAEFTRDFFQAFVVHIDDEITMLTSFGLGEAQVMLLMSNQLMQICDDLFEFRHAAINVANANRTETGARYAWVSLQALGKMSEYLKSKFKHHPSITGTFVRFLTRQTADTSAAGLSAKLATVEAGVKSLKTSAATKTELQNLHNKLDLIIAANDLKKK